MSEFILRRGKLSDADFLTTAVIASGEHNMRFLLSREPSAVLHSWISQAKGLFSYRSFWVIEVDQKPIACASILHPNQRTHTLLATWWQFRPYTPSGLRLIKRLSQLSEPMTQPADNLSVISSVYVDPAYRQQKVATRLLKALIQQYHGAVALQVALTNSHAIQLYQTLGFKALGRSAPSSVIEPHQLMVFSDGKT